MANSKQHMTRPVEKLVRLGARDDSTTDAVPAPAEARFRRMYEEAPECIKILSLHGVLHDMNATGLALLGAPNLEAVRGHAVSDIVAPEHRDGFRDYLQGVVEGRYRDPYEFEILSSDGTRRWMETHMVPFQDGAETRLLGITRDVSARKRAEDELVHHSFCDGLTQLPNRRRFRERLEQAMADADRRERFVCVMFLDLDDFKRINDTLGHEAGDDLIRAVATRLSSCMRAGDTVARLSGDEFGFVITDVNHVDVGASVATRIMEQFRAPFDIANNQLRVTASLGMTFYPMDDSSVEGLLKNADTAMYRAKQLGKNTFEIYGWEMSSSVRRRVSVESALRRAIEQNELGVVYQPIISLDTGRIAGAEALVRWLQPNGIEVPAVEFIAVAEEGPLIVALGARVRDAAFRLGAGIALPGDFRISVNLSARELEDATFLAHVQQLAADTGVAPSRIGFEIPETVLMHDTGRISALLASLRTSGFSIAVDRFGSGYSNLGHLRRLPLAALNISPAIVRVIATDASAASVANAAIGLAHSFGLAAVAKGIETETQREILRNLGCDFGQGNLYGRPMSPAAIEALVRREAS
jgi:diguanylate cyclase (GGDEF)-like protein/PAS domain S-box-containing protein